MRAVKGKLWVYAVVLPVWLTGTVLCCRAETLWRVYRDCTLLDNASNDGDSFHVDCNGKHYIFRICYVDAPETETSLPRRIKEQAAYWGTDAKGALQIGKAAAKFTQERLQKGFTVYTRMEDAKGRSTLPRYFAMVKVGEEYLSMALVENGLARIYGKRVNLPDGTGWRKYLDKLEATEKRAKLGRKGGWGQPSGRRSRVRPVEEQTIVLPRAVAAYASDRSSRFLRVLPRGTQVKVLGAESHAMLRIRFEHDGEAQEATCRRADLGL